MRWEGSTPWPISSRRAPTASLMAWPSSGAPCDALRCWLSASSGWPGPPLADPAQPIAPPWPTLARQWERYGEYLTGLGGREHRDRVFDYVAREDSPRPLLYQLDLLRRYGLEVEVLHVNACFAAFGGVRPA